MLIAYDGQLAIDFWPNNEFSPEADAWQKAHLANGCNVEFSNKLFCYAISQAESYEDLPIGFIMQNGRAISVISFDGEFYNWVSLSPHEPIELQTTWSQLEPKLNAEIAKLKGY